MIFPTDMRFVIVDPGCYAVGWWEQLPSGWCCIEIAVWYRGPH
jgi:hypothetical protein